MLPHYYWGARMEQSVVHTTTPLRPYPLGSNARTVGRSRVVHGRSTVWDPVHGRPSIDAPNPKPTFALDSAAPVVRLPPSRQSSRRGRVAVAPRAAAAPDAHPAAAASRDRLVHATPTVQIGRGKEWRSKRSPSPLPPSGVTSPRPRPRGRGAPLGSR